MKKQARKLYNLNQFHDSNLFICKMIGRNIKSNHYIQKVHLLNVSSHTHTHRNHPSCEYGHVRKVSRQEYLRYIWVSFTYVLVRMLCPFRPWIEITLLCLASSPMTWEQTSPMHYSDNNTFPLNVKCKWDTPGSSPFLWHWDWTASCTDENKSTNHGLN